MRFAEAWDRFWFEPAPLARLAAFRALVMALVFIAAACSDDEDSPDTTPAAGSGGSSGGSSGGKSAGGKAGMGGSAQAGNIATGGTEGGDGGRASAGEAGAPSGVGGLEVGGAGGDGTAGEPGAGGAPPVANLVLDADPAKDTLLATLENGDVRALYFYGNDAPASSERAAISACTGACLDVWPVFHESSIVTGDGLSPADFGEVARPDGLTQSTFKGWPLYRYTPDSAATDRTGDGVDSLWHAVEQPFYAFTLRQSTVGNVAVLHLATAQGHTIYNFNDDLPGTETMDPVSGCVSNGCRRAWPVVAPPLTKAVSSVTGVFDPFVRPDTKAIQFAYEDLPVYTFFEDVLPGDLNGLLKANWVVAAP